MRVSLTRFGNILNSIGIWWVYKGDSNPGLTRISDIKWLISILGEHNHKNVTVYFLRQHGEVIGDLEVRA
ncbi:hypothetical protein EB809_18700 [Marinobacter sp. R17]|nr:hypothetical protein EB809_18700 [Marinobacter sp. R17]